MIDDIQKTNLLIEKMKSELPIPAYPTKQLCKYAKAQSNIYLNRNHLMEIIDVMYGGEEVGIACNISKRNAKDVLFVSVTHLQIDETHKLSKNISEYQKNRIKKMEIN
jgi:hypothetical protein